MFHFLWWKDWDIILSLMNCCSPVCGRNTRSSSSCASYALRRIAKDSKGSFSVDATSTNLKKFYVYDLLNDTEACAIHLYQELKALFQIKTSNCTK